MQPLDIISINIWQIVISLINLVILFFIVKKILFEPVKKMVAEREALKIKHSGRVSSALPIRKLMTSSRRQLPRLTEDLTLSSVMLRSVPTVSSDRLR